MCQNLKQNLETIFTEGVDSTVAVIGILNPTWSGLAQLKTDAALAEQAIANWTPTSGTEATVVEVINVVIDDISAFNGVIPPEYQAIIVVALDGIKSVIVLLGEQTTSAPAQTAALKTMEASKWVPPTAVYTSTRQWALAYNKAVSAHPNLSTAKVNVPKKWHILP